MHRDGSYGYYSESDFSAVKLPYKGNETSMLIILPARDKMAQVESSLSPAFLASVRSSLQSAYLALYSAEIHLHHGIDRDVGSPDFARHGLRLQRQRGFFGNRWNCATFASRKFIIRRLLRWTKKAPKRRRPTAVIVGPTAVAPPQTTFFADRPFIFLICDDPTGAVLFMGKLVDPSQN